MVNFHWFSRKQCQIGIGNLPGDNSETGVLDGVGLCPGGRKCDGEPLLEPPPGAEMSEKQKKDRKTLKKGTNGCQQLPRVCSVWVWSATPEEFYLSDDATMAAGVCKQTPLLLLHVI